MWLVDSQGVEQVEQTTALTGDGALRSEEAALPLGSIRKVDESRNLLNQKIQNVLCAKTGERMNNPPNGNSSRCFFSKKKCEVSTFAFQEIQAAQPTKALIPRFHRQNQVSM